MSLGEEEVTKHWKGWSAKKEEKEEGKPIGGGESTGRYWNPPKRQRDIIYQSHGGSRMLEKRYLQYFHRGQEQPYEKLVIPSQQSRPVKREVSEA